MHLKVKVVGGFLMTKSLTAGVGYCRCGVGQVWDRAGVG